MWTIFKVFIEFVIILHIYMCESESEAAQSCLTLRPHGL